MAELLGAALSVFLSLPGISTLAGYFQARYGRLRAGKGRIQSWCIQRDYMYEPPEISINIVCHNEIDPTKILRDIEQTLNRNGRYSDKRYF